MEIKKSLLKPKKITDYKEYTWNPQEDISPYELSVCMGFLLEKKPLSVSEIRKYGKIYRHFLFK